MKVIILSSLLLFLSDYSHSKVMPDELLSNFKHLLYKGLFSDDMHVFISAKDLTVKNEKYTSYPVFKGETHEFIHSMEVTPFSLKLKDKQLQVSCIWIKGHFSFAEGEEYKILDRVILPIESQNCSGPIQMNKGLSEDVWSNRLEIKKYNLKKNSAAEIVIHYYGNSYGLVRPI